MRRPAPVRTALFAALACALGCARLGGGPGLERSGWRDTLDRVAHAVVVLRVTAPRAFDTERAATSTATGFVVDAERGLIVTNRHVVHPGPVVAEAVFLDHEEVPVEAVYRDPVHDFGFFRYDPAAVRFMEPVALDLVPGHARVGAEIRVVGNDAGEKLSILAGTLARLDRAAPIYGASRYNDFNTFYYQAASATSGGSSGSPVVDVHGHAVALNAGGRRRASSSFYLPLEPIARALALVRAGAPVPRGTLQAVFGHRPYDELRRLGLSPATEASVRDAFPRETGMLVVDEIVPDGPADGRLEVGDVLVSVAGQLVTRFWPLERALDHRVSGRVDVAVERGGEALRLELPVRDLAAVTPDEFVEVGGAVVHPLSYQQARNHGVPVGGLYVASPGYMLGHAGVPPNALVSRVDGRPVSTLDAFEERVAALADGARVPFRFSELDDRHTERVAVVTVDRRWFPMQRCRLDATGRWPCRPSPPAPAAASQEPSTTEFARGGGRPERDLEPSLAMVSFGAPLRTDGLRNDRFLGAGLVVDPVRGLVVVDRETVPTALGDVRLTFAASVEVPGEIVYLHPVHNLAVVHYAPALLGDTPVRAPRLQGKPIREGQDVWLVGLDERYELVSHRTRVARIGPRPIPIPTPPRFRQTNLEVVTLDDDTPTVGGVLADGEGRVLALWSSFATEKPDGEDAFFAGFPIQRVREVLPPLSERAGFRHLGVELETITLAEARRRGMSEPLARRFEHEATGSRRVLSVARLFAGTPAADVLREGDLLLRAGGEFAASFAVVERAAQAERVRLALLRDGEELALDVATVALDGRGTDRCLVWAGAVLQEPHLALAAQRGLPRDGVYVSSVWFGSPANRYELRATRRIVAVDGVPTPDLDAFLAETSGRPDRSPVRLRALDLAGRAEVLSLKLDLHYWPTTELRRNGAGWQRIVHDGSAASPSGGVAARAEEEGASARPGAALRRERSIQ